MFGGFGLVILGGCFADCVLLLCASFRMFWWVFCVVGAGDSFTLGCLGL